MMRILPRVLALPPLAGTWGLGRRHGGRRCGKRGVRQSPGHSGRTCTADQSAPRVTTHVPSPCRIETERPAMSLSEKPDQEIQGCVASMMACGAARVTISSQAEASSV